MIIMFVTAFVIAGCGNQNATEAKISTQGYYARYDQMTWGESVNGLQIHVDIDTEIFIAIGTLRNSCSQPIEYDEYIVSYWESNWVEVRGETDWRHVNRWYADRRAELDEPRFGSIPYSPRRILQPGQLLFGGTGKFSDRRKIIEIKEDVVYSHHADGRIELQRSRGPRRTTYIDSEAIKLATLPQCTFYTDLLEYDWSEWLVNGQPLNVRIVKDMYINPGRMVELRSPTIAINAQVLREYIATLDRDARDVGEQN